MANTDPWIMDIIIFRKPQRGCQIQACDVIVVHQARHIMCGFIRMSSEFGIKGPADPLQSCQGSDIYEKNE